MKLKQIYNAYIHINEGYKTSSHSWLLKEWTCCFLEPHKMNIQNSQQQIKTNSVICTDEEPDYVQWEPAEPLSPVATGFYGQEDRWLGGGWKQKIKIYATLKCLSRLWAKIILCQH